VPIGDLTGARFGGLGPTGSQDAEKVRQLRSRIVQTLNVPQRVRLGPSLAAALLDGLFEHPAGAFYCYALRGIPYIFGYKSTA
jgi:hypothetical protein